MDISPDLLARYPVSALRDRHGLKSHQSVYDRLLHLEIKPEKQGREPTISIVEVEHLDKLHLHLKQGGKLSDYLAANTDAAIQPRERIGRKEFRPIEAPSVKEQIETIKLRYETLKWLADNEVAVTSEELSMLNGVYPQGAEITRGSFKFKKVGKSGNRSTGSIIHVRSNWF
jgi:hypothetical protein